MAELACLGVAAALLVGCGPSSSGGPTSTALRHVFLIVMENQTPAEALSGQFTASLAATYGVATNYHAIAHPSVPNYLALTSGSTWGVTDDSFHVLPRADLGDELTTAGVSWRAYMEGLVGGECLTSPLPYDPGHNPFAFYGGSCPANVVPLTGLTSDLATNAPWFTWISPDRCHDEHDCPVSVGDAWLRGVTQEILQSAAWRSGGVLIVTWDEDDGSADNRVLTLVISPGLAHRTSSQPYDHYSLLATIQDLLHLKRLGAAASATPMTDLV